MTRVKCPHTRDEQPESEEKTVRSMGEEGYSPDCPACLRHRPHTDTEHEAALARVFSNSLPD